jgi:hypothetical protein
VLSCCITQGSLFHIVTCQPFVGWCNGVARHRPVNKVSTQTRWCHPTALEYGSCAAVPRSRGDVTCVYMVARKRACCVGRPRGCAEKTPPPLTAARRVFSRELFSGRLPSNAPLRNPCRATQQLVDMSQYYFQQHSEA